MVRRVLGEGYEGGVGDITRELVADAHIIKHYIPMRGFQGSLSQPSCRAARSILYTLRFDILIRVQRGCAQSFLFRGSDNNGGKSLRSNGTARRQRRMHSTCPQQSTAS